MSENPEVLRANIERTRADLSADVDALADKVSPSHIVDRQTAKVKDSVRRGVSGVRDRVMGVADSASDGTHAALDGVSDSLADAGSAIGDAPHRAAVKTQGNPLAAGLIAFGAGMLISSLIPASEKERQAADAVKNAAEPLTNELGQVAQEVGHHLQEPAQRAMDSVKATAGEAADRIKDESQAAAGDVADQASQAKDNIQAG